MDAAFRGVRKNVLEKMGLLGHPFSEAKRGKWRDLISLLSWGKKDRGGLQLILEVSPWFRVAKGDTQLDFSCVRVSLKGRRKLQWDTAT